MGRRKFQGKKIDRFGHAHRLAAAFALNADLQHRLQAVLGSGSQASSLTVPRSRLPTGTGARKHAVEAVVDAHAQPSITKAWFMSTGSSDSVKTMRDRRAKGPLAARRGPRGSIAHHRGGGKGVDT